MDSFQCIYALFAMVAMQMLQNTSGQVTHCKANGKCLALVNNQQPTWAQAESYCQQHYPNQGHLASLHVQQDKLIISLWLPFLTTNPWVGGHHYGNLSYQWTDGTPFDYTNWMSGQPNVTSGCIKMCHREGANCSAVGKWMSAQCSETGQLICEYGNLYVTPTQPPTQVSNTVCQPGSDRCFTAFSGHLTWVEAENFCELHNFTALASIQNPFDATIIDSSFVPFPTLTNDLWLGGERINSRANFQWSDGSPFAYTQWANGQPSASGDACTKVCRTNDGNCQLNKWVATPCDTKLSFICENGTAVASTTTTTTTTTTPGPPTDCLDVYNNYNTQSGVYTIYPPNYRAPFQVLCDMTDGGGWTVIQKRTDGNVVFWNQNWQNYKLGFWDFINRNQWLGLDKIHALSTKDASVTLRTDMWGNRCTNCGSTSTSLANGYWFDERGFYIDNEANAYQLHVTNYTAGNASNNVSQYNYNNGQKFTTVDRDNDHRNGNCAGINNGGGWWYNSCSNIFLNGQYGTTQAAMGLSWDVPSYWINPIRTEMRLRRNS